MTKASCGGQGCHWEGEPKLINETNFKGQRRQIFGNCAEKYQKNRPGSTLQRASVHSQHKDRDTIQGRISG